MFFFFATDWVIIFKPLNWFRNNYPFLFFEDNRWVVKQDRLMNEIYSIQHRLGIVDFTSISKPQINWLCTAWAVRRERFFIVQVYGYINWCGVVIVSLVSPCSTVRGREVQRLVALYPTVRLSPWRQVRKNIHARVWTPGPTWSVLHPPGSP